ncbi:MAG: hypothetical protein H6733_04340 [Alphaproteobacteria bacterium]|nr:hypothetical protein [Alphaproteobacteria bacterium]
MKEPGAPGQIPKSKGVPRDQGKLPGQGTLPGQGVPRDEGVPRDAAILPGAAGQKLPGSPGQVVPGTPGQLHKHAENPWAPTDDTVVTDPSDALVPPSRPLPDPEDDTGDAT